MKMNKGFLGALGVAVLALGTQAQAGIITFSDSSLYALAAWPGSDAQIPNSINTVAGLPDGITVNTWSNMNRNYQGLGDHTQDTANTYLWSDSASPAASSIVFSAPVIVSSLWMVLDSWCPTPADVYGYAGGVQVWHGSTSVMSPDISNPNWVNITDGAGVSIDTLSFGAHWARVDDISVDAVPEPASLSLLGVAALGLLARRRKA